MGQERKAETGTTNVKPLTDSQYMNSPKCFFAGFFCYNDQNTLIVKYSVSKQLIKPCTIN